MKLILIRHAESVANKKGISQGQKVDTPLTEEGKQQAIKVANRLDKEDLEVDVIYASSLKRTKQTAEIVGDKLGIGTRYDKRLIDIANHRNESIESLVDRTKSFLRYLDKEHYKDTVLIITHQGNNKTILGISTGDREEGAKLAREIEQENACVNVLSKVNGESQIDLINCTRHL